MARGYPIRSIHGSSEYNVTLFANNGGRSRATALRRVHARCAGAYSSRARCFLARSCRPLLLRLCSCHRAQRDGVKARCSLQASWIGWLLRRRRLHEGAERLFPPPSTGCSVVGQRAASLRAALRALPSLHLLLEGLPVVLVRPVEFSNLSSTVGGFRTLNMFETPVTARKTRELRTISLGNSLKSESFAHFRERIIAQQFAHFRNRI